MKKIVIACILAFMPTATSIAAESTMYICTAKDKKHKGMIHTVKVSYEPEEDYALTLADPESGSFKKFANDGAAVFKGKIEIASKINGQTYSKVYPLIITQKPHGGYSLVGSFNIYNYPASIIIHQWEKDMPFFMHRLDWTVTGTEFEPGIVTGFCK